jgi:hypothetical protein
MHTSEVQTDPNIKRKDRKNSKKGKEHKKEKKYKTPTNGNGDEQKGDTEKVSGHKRSREWVYDILSKFHQAYDGFRSLDTIDTEQDSKPIKLPKTIIKLQEMLNDLNATEAQEEEDHKETMKLLNKKLFKLPEEINAAIKKTVDAAFDYNETTSYPYQLAESMTFLESSPDMIREHVVGISN